MGRRLALCVFKMRSVREPSWPSNVLGSFEHAVKLLVGRFFPIVGNRCKAALLTFGLEREPTIEPLFTEGHAEFFILARPTLGRGVWLIAAAPFGSLRND
jgi:hypothetical protein